MLLILTDCIINFNVCNSANWFIFYSVFLYFLIKFYCSVYSNKIILDFALYKLKNYCYIIVIVLYQVVEVLAGQEVRLQDKKVEPSLGPPEEGIPPSALQATVDLNALVQVSKPFCIYFII